MSKTRGLLKWKNQILRRVERWWGTDPEFQHYLPEHQDEFRTPSPM
jgi:hypothetical protein